MRYKLTLGDWSGDGHSISRDIYVEVNYDFADLQTNYLKNTEKFGFGLDEVASEFDSPALSAEYFEALTAAGFKFGSVDPDYLEDLFAENGDVWIGEEEFIEIAMFMIGNGLSGFAWSQVHDTATVLLGGYNALKGRKGYTVGSGYGLYHP